MDKSATPIQNKYLTGDQAEQDSTKGMTSPSYKTPGPTVRLRGVEANTNKRDGVWSKVPEPQDVTDLVYGVSDAPAYRVHED